MFFRGIGRPVSGLIILGSLVYPPLGGVMLGAGRGVPPEGYVWPGLLVEPDRAGQLFGLASLE